MEFLLLYLLKANVVLALFAAAYYGLLRRLTFFGLNRAYLALALLFAAVYPALPVPALLPARVALLPTAVVAPGAGLAAGRATAATAGLSWQGLALGLYAAGTGLLLLRLLGQLGSLALVRRRSRPAVVLGQPVRVLPGAGGPFSFGRTIYLSACALADAASLPAALLHEQAHVRQHHTLDVLLTQLATALAWPNPAAWLLRRAVLDNLEYLADQAALRSGLDRRAYQYSLLRQQPGGVPAPALAFHFSFLTLKNRITMLNQPASTTGQLGRYLLAAPLLVALALGYSGARAQAGPTLGQQAPLANALYYLDGQPSTQAAFKALDPSSISSIDVVKDPATVSRVFKSAAPGVVAVTTKANANAPAVLALAEQANLSAAYTYSPAQVNAVVPKALAYITSHYPDARLSGEVTEVKRKSTGEVRYQVQLVRGRRPFYVLFTPQGDFVAQ
ncbi:M56 family metallopeptidase [Hymenobacter cheonanensis]|uniref:M56 family metallopeptidase n=1 Tax=Hymenobacter sp. CA2-7 TaxID=3063993 RepID=UPI0027125C42|nr:M56 family metallopeptidase [Hymenobacter sp. CA2-7]MDO7884884.1 M56 family metallopeptidase [Hymenobacter sp. CA2-7]